MIADFNQLDFNQKYSYQDYLKWHFKERVELIKGKIFKMSPAPSRLHQQIVVQLTGLLWSFFRTRPCQVFVAPFDVRLPVSGDSKGQLTVVQPDLCIICDNDKLDERGCVGAPDLIIEVLSPGNTQHEMNRKYDLYQEAGVKEYWLIEPKDKAIFVYVLNEEAKYIGLKPYTESQSIVSSTIPKLKIDLKEVFTV